MEEKQIEKKLDNQRRRERIEIVSVVILLSIIGAFAFYIGSFFW